MPLVLKTGASSVASQVAEHYRALILSGRIHSGERLPSIRTMAQELGISYGPIHAAFSTLEVEGLVHRHPRVGTVVGSGPFQVPASMELGVIFRAVPAWTQGDNYGLGMFHGIQKALTDGSHKTVLFTPSFEGREIAADVVRQFVEHSAHGFVVDDWVPDDVVAQMAATGRPVAVIDRKCPVDGVSSVYRDNAQAARETARQIVAHGHRVVSCICRDTWNSHQAADAFLAAMYEANLAIPAKRVGMYYDEIPDDGLKEFIKQIVCSVPVPTAIYCTDDLLANMTCMNLSASGQRIPDHISIVGTLDLPLAQQVVPPLTTFRFEPSCIGRTAVEEVVERCRDKRRPARDIAIPGAWVERGSLISVSVR